LFGRAQRSSGPHDDNDRSGDSGTGASGHLNCGYASVDRTELHGGFRTDGYGLDHFDDRSRHCWFDHDDHDDDLIRNHLIRNHLIRNHRYGHGHDPHTRAQPSRIAVVDGNRNA